MCSIACFDDVIPYLRWFNIMINIQVLGASSDLRVVPLH